jgi:hypothetical protein
MSVDIARSEIDMITDQMNKTITKVCESVKKSGHAVAWKKALDTQAIRTKIYGHTKSLQNICDWAQGPDGCVDEGKLPRSSWQQYGLDAHSLSELNRVLFGGWKHQSRLDGFLKAATRAEKLFQ